MAAVGNLLARHGGILEGTPRDEPNRINRVSNNKACQGGAIRSCFRLQLIQTSLALDSESGIRQSKNSSGFLMLLLGLIVGGRRRIPGVLKERPELSENLRSRRPGSGDIPSIRFARSSCDALAGQGTVHAEDRTSRSTRCDGFSAVAAKSFRANLNQHSLLDSAGFALCGRNRPSVRPGARQALEYAAPQKAIRCGRNCSLSNRNTCSA